METMKTMEQWSDEANGNNGAMETMPCHAIKILMLKIMYLLFKEGAVRRTFALRVLKLIKEKI